MPIKKFVVFEGLKEGNRFYTANSERKDHTKISDGTVVYKILGFVDTDEEALEIIKRDDPRTEQERISDYLFKSGRGIFTKEACDNLARILNKGS